MIKFKCGNCNHQTGVPDRYASKRLRCPQCGTPTRVPKSAGKTDAQDPGLIKFRCPNCNQKIGVGPDYAGRTVKCAKCKNPLHVPQACDQAERSAVKDETAVLKTGHQQYSADEGVWGDMEGMNELLSAEAGAPSVEMPPEQSAMDYDTGESETSSQTSSLAKSPPKADMPGKNRSIIIGITCVLVLLLVGGAALYLPPVTIIILAILLVSIVHVVSMWIVFEKAGQPGWAVLVPIYNMWVWAEVGDKPGWWGLVMAFGGIIPIVGPIIEIVLWILISVGIARAFGRGVGFGIGLILVPFIFYPILAFSN